MGWFFTTNLQKNINIVKQQLCAFQFIAHMTIIPWKKLKSMSLTQILKNKALCIVWFFDILQKNTSDY